MRLLHKPATSPSVPLVNGNPCVKASFFLSYFVSQLMLQTRPGLKHREGGRGGETYFTVTLVDPGRRLTMLLCPVGACLDFTCVTLLSEACRFLAGTLVLPLLSPDLQAICFPKTCSVGVPLTFPMILSNRNQNSTVLSFSLTWSTSGSQKYSPILYFDKFWEWRQIAKQLLLCCQSSWLLPLAL